MRAEVTGGDCIEFSIPGWSVVGGVRIPRAQGRSAQPLQRPQGWAALMSNDTSVTNHTEEMAWRSELYPLRRVHGHLLRSSAYPQTWEH